jgi:hypothetical protein
MKWLFLESKCAMVAVCLLLASAFPGWAQSRSIEQPTPILSMTTTEFVEGRIGAVNQDSRIATVNLSDGRVVTGTVKQVPGGRGLLTAGDLIAASLEQRLSFVVAPESTAPPSDFESSGSEQLPPGVFTGQMIETWLVVGTNVAASTISLVRPDSGQVLTFEVRTWDGRPTLPRARAGNKLIVVNAEYRLARVKRKS